MPEDTDQAPTSPNLVGIGRTAGNKVVELVCAALAAFSLYAALNSISPFIETVKMELEVSYVSLGLLYSAPFLMLTLMSIAGGALTDRIGVSKTGALGLLLIGLGGSLRSVSTDFANLLIFTLILGIGCAIFMPSVPKLLGSLFPSKRIGAATATYVISGGIGGSISLAVSVPLLLPALSSWRGVNMVWGGLTLAMSLAWFILIKGDRTKESPQPDGLNGTPNGSTRLFRSRKLWLVAWILSLASVLAFVSQGWFPTIFQARGVDAESAALMASVYGWVGVVGGVLIPTLSDRAGLRRPFLIGSSLLGVVGGVALWYMPPNLGWVAAGVIGFASFGVFPLCLLLPVEFFEAKLVGRAGGLMFSVGYVGAVIGPMIVGYLRDLTGSFWPTAPVIVVSSLLIAFLTLGLPETGRRRRKVATES